MSSTLSTHMPKKVWLTFDDGPHPECTSMILDTLKAYAVRATFFVVGANVEQIGDALLKRMGDEGHSIGNHTYSHRDLTTLTQDVVLDEIVRTDKMLAGLPNAEKLFRPPYGASNSSVDRTLSSLGYRKVLWNVDTRDWNPAYQPDGWVERAVAGVRERDCSIVLAHYIHPSTAEHLAMLLERLGSPSFDRLTAMTSASDPSPARSSPSGSATME